MEICGTDCASIINPNTWVATLVDNSTDDVGVKQVTVNWGDGGALSSAIDTIVAWLERKDKGVPINEPLRKDCDDLRRDLGLLLDRDQALSAHHCHCRDCRKMTGSGKATIIMVPTGALQTEGELKTYTVSGTILWDSALFTGTVDELPRLEFSLAPIGGPIDSNK